MIWSETRNESDNSQCVSKKKGQQTVQRREIAENPQLQAVPKQIPPSYRMDVTYNDKVVSKVWV